MSDETRSSRRNKSRGAEARRAARTGGGAQTIMKAIDRKIPTFDPLNEEQLLIIEANADRILEEIGIEFRDDPEVLELWKNAGADVKGDSVHFPKGLCRELLKTAPSSFVQHARNPERNVTIGGTHTVFAPVYGPPFVTDLDQGRRYATMQDFENLVKLIYTAPYLHHSGGTVCEPVDVPVNKRHLDMVYTHMRYSDKPFMGSVTAPERAQDTVDMCKILFGEEFVDQNCVVINLINANSPMVFDGTMLGAMRVYASNNQASVISPFILSGAMSPVTVAGTISQIIAEMLAGCATTQLVRKGSPVVAGTFASAISMQSGAPTFGTPEPSLVTYGVGQLVRRMGIPFRSGGGLCGSKTVDTQAAFEAANTMNMTLMSGVNFALHSAGWLEGGLATSYEKLILDVDQLGILQRISEGYDLSENGLAFDAMKEVGPGNHFLGCSHTQANFENAFYRTTTADNATFEQWSAEGSLDAAQRANATWKKWLENYKAPPIDFNIDEALKAFIAEKKGSMPDSYIS